MFGALLHRDIELRFYANSLEMVIQSAVACSEAKDGGLLAAVECGLVWVVSSSLAVGDGFSFYYGYEFSDRDKH